VADALARELHEELGLRIRAPQPWVTRTFTYPHATVRLHFCKVRGFDGVPQSLEQQAFGWSDPVAPAVAPILPAALPILPWLALPDVFDLQQVNTGLRAPRLEDAVILNTTALEKQTARPDHRWVGAHIASVHDLELAQQAGCDFALVPSSPVAGQLAQYTPIPLYVIEADAHALRAVAMGAADTTAFTAA
jgi:8-oxo-dGTP diphosphatase